MSVNPEECRRSGWAEWAERKKTNNVHLLGENAQNCKNCAHCTWITVGKTNHFPGVDEIYCHRKIGGERVTVDLTGAMPENCNHFCRRKYAKNES